MIEVTSLSYTYPNGITALHDISLTIDEGEFIAIMGENGAGKTTLIKHFNGLLKPSEGHVIIDGVDTKDVSVAALAKKVGLVFQNADHQLFSETVKEDISFGLSNFGYPRPRINKRVRSMMKLLDLERYQNVSPFSLSGGEKKRVALASVLAWDPQYLVLDEPTIGQDALQKERLKNFILQLKTRGKSVIIVTHDIEFVAECHPRVIVISKGKVLADDTAEKIFSNKKIVQQGSLVMPQIALLLRALKYPFSQDVIDIHSVYPLIKHFLSGEHENVDEHL